MDIDYPDHLKIIKQEGFEKNFKYDLTDLSSNQFQIQVCHKDYNKNKNKEKLDKYKVKTLKKGDGSSSPDIDIELDLKNKECDSFIVEFQHGDILKLGENSTEIILTDDNVTIIVSPEANECSYLYCESEITIENDGSTNLTINTKDLNAGINADYSWIDTLLPFTVQYLECDDEDCNTSHYENTTIYKLSNEERNITIEPSQAQIFYLKAIMPDENTEFKYNVSFFYLNHTHSIDPYFNTTNSSFNLGTFNHTYLNESGFVQLNLSYPYGEYYSRIYDSNVSAYWNTLSFYENQEHWSEYQPDGNTLLYCSFNDTTTCPVGNMNGKIATGINYLTGKFETDGVHVDSTDILSYNSTNLNKTVGSLSFWFKSDTDYWNDGLPYYLFHYYGDGNNDILIYKGASNTLLLRYRGGAVSRQYLTSISQSFGTNWHHFVMTWDNLVDNHLYVYIDGEALSPVPSVLQEINVVPTRFYIGSSYSGVSQADGTFEDFFLTDDVITPAEVLELYKTGQLRLNITVRSCDDANCVGESFSGNYDSSPITLSVPNNRYFQYKAIFESFDQNHTPELWNVSVQYDINCTPNWTVQYDSCLYNDSRLKYYNDSNSCGITYGLPVDNNTYVSCNYCTEDLEKEIISNCTYNGTDYSQFYIWEDENYYSCCVLTNITSDCSILYSPYNMTHEENCVIITEEFELDIDDEFYFGVRGFNKDKLSAKIFINDTNITYNCVTFMETTGEMLLQTNPVYTKRTTSTISLFNKEVEDREFFTTQNGLANVYWTDENLVIDGRVYIAGVECVGEDGTHLLSEKLVNVYYEPVNAPITRWFWIRDNFVPIFLGFILLIIIILIVSWAIAKVRRG